MNGRCPLCGGRKITWTPRTCLAAVSAWVAEYGKPPTADGWRLATPHTPSSTTVLRVFGSWNAMIMQAGFEPRHRGQWKKGQRMFSREQILSAIYLFRYENGRLPLYSDWDHAVEGRPTSHQVVRVFGSWNSAIVAAGYTPNRPRRSPEGYRNLTGSVTRQAVVAA